VEGKAVQQKLKRTIGVERWGGLAKVSQTNGKGFGGTDTGLKVGEINCKLTSRRLTVIGEIGVIRASERNPINGYGGKRVLDLSIEIKAEGFILGQMYS